MVRDVVITGFVVGFAAGLGEIAEDTIGSARPVGFRRLAVTSHVGRDDIELPRARIDMVDALR